MPAGELSLVIAALAITLGEVGCRAGGPECATGISTVCASIYDPPTFQTIFDKTLQPTCSAGNGTCHDPSGARAGLVLADADAAYALLLAPPGATPRVQPGDPSCSLIVERLTSSDPNRRMPPGPTPLLPGEICAVVKWIAAGAQR